MKNLTKSMMIAAAALVVAAGVAGAQTIKAEVPFGFRAAGTVMPAGAYKVHASTGSGSLVFQLTNEDTKRSILTVPQVSNNLKKGETAVSLTFECTSADCALIRVAPGTGQSYQIWKPKVGHNEDTRLAVIRAVLVNAR